MEIDEKILQPVKFNYILVDNYLINKGIQRNIFADYIGISESAVSQILCGTRNPSAETAVRIARFTGISLDLLYETKTNNDINTISLPKEITDNIKEYLSNETKTYIIKSIKKDKENKYKRILNSLVATKIDGEYGEETFIQMFAENILNILVCAKINDTTFMKSFVESANKLSIEINKFKTKAIVNDKLDLEFQQILDKSNEVKGLYENTKEDLHRAIDTILQTVLENEFDAIKPSETLF